MSNFFEFIKPIIPLLLVALYIIYRIWGESKNE